jgi:catechol 2,3-dioxygenase-like lactoylglutathione lyase family enzyme
MAIQLNNINHVCLVVRDQAASEKFYVGVMGLKRHHKVKSWFALTPNSTLHLVEIPEASADGSLYHEIQHFALEVTDLRVVLKTLLSERLSPFQMDFEGNQRQVGKETDSLDFGIGTLFVNDPDGNLVEFVQLGQGVFKEG